MKQNTPVVLWFRQDLRLEDNPSLSAAMNVGPVIPLFIWDAEQNNPWRRGAASRWWLSRSLQALDESLQNRGSRLVIRQGRSAETLGKFLEETGARRVFSGTTHVSSANVSGNFQLTEFPGRLLLSPETIQNRQGKPYQIFTPFWKVQFAAFEPSPPIKAPQHIPAPKTWPSSLPVEMLGLEPRINWTSGIEAAWKPGEHGAAAMLKQFLDYAFINYPNDRDRPDIQGTSRLSPYLHFGEISPGKIWRATRERAAANNEDGSFKAEESYLRQLAWREFAYHLLVHHPDMLDEPLRPDFSIFPWRDDEKAFEAWKRGCTGYPIVDAGARELWTTGWMHNRVRMIAASFLVKHLMIPWKRGAHWFWDALVDADPANNAFGWQWTAGCGADAAPYFRIFNPVLQGEKFDPHGDYVRRWVPELADVPAKWIHAPWKASPTVLKESGVYLGGNYPERIVDLTFGRDRALEAHRSFLALSRRKK
jgi:deoxyribodipyrimidine photo-lyase